MNKLVFLLLFSISFGCYSQEVEEETEVETKTKEPKDKEIGIDGVFHVSNMGGSYGFGLKLALIKNEKLVFGPSIRFQRVWSKFNGLTSYFNAFGAGAFVHYRYKNIVFAAAELDFYKSPRLDLQNTYNTNKVLVTVFLVGGGISRAFPVGIRINAGVYWDIINDLNSPLRLTYFSKNNQGALQPIIYRVEFHFPF